MDLVASQSKTGLRREDFFDSARSLFGNIRQRFLNQNDREKIVLDYVSLGSCRLSTLAAPPHGVLGRDVAKKSYDADCIKVLVQVSGKSKLYQDGDRVQLGANSAVIYDPTRPYSLINASDVRQIILQAPRDLFMDRALRRLSRPLFLPSACQQQSVTLSSFIQTSASTAPFMGEGVRQSLGQSLTVFTQGILADHFHDQMIEAVQMGSLTLLRQRIKEHITANITDPDLSLEKIAKRMGCSLRYLHRAFEAEGETVRGYLMRKRLETSRDILLDPANRHRTIAELAFKSGFNSSAHFCRAFKQHYQRSPSQMRNQIYS